MERTEIVVYTDGSCKGNPGPGGWAAILTCGNKEFVLTGSEEHTTNNRMELTAVIKAVEFCKKPHRITIVADSTYVMMTQTRWKKQSKQADWKNSDLWYQLLSACKAGGHTIRYEHVYGHRGHDYNERCDKLAKEQAELAGKDVAHGVLP